MPDSPSNLPPNPEAPREVGFTRGLPCWALWDSRRLIAQTWAKNEMAAKLIFASYGLRGDRIACLGTSRSDPRRPAS